jgi:hypothetical protein
MSQQSTDELAVSRSDGTYAVQTRAGNGEPWSTTTSGEGWWPTWRPGARQLVTSAVTRAGSTDSRAVLRFLEPGTEGALDVPGSVSAPAALIADRLAHYPLWSPNGSALCYVAPAGRTLAARLWRTRDTEERALLGGAPVFPAWDPSGEHIVLHHGSSLTTIHAKSLEETRLSDNAAGFRTVAFQGDAFVFAEPSAAGVRIMFGHVDGGPSRPGPELRGGVAFAPRPGSSTVLAGVTVGAEAGVFSELVVLDFADPQAEPQRLVKGPLMAAWWAPDGERLAVLVPSYTGDGRFQLRFHRADGRFERAMEPTTLSQDMRTMVSFFDQYSLSHKLWSADGRWFAMSGRVVSDGPHASFAQAGLDQVLVADTAEVRPWEFVSNGLAGFFRPDLEVNGG